MNHRLLLWTMLAGLAVAMAACAKPKADDCEKAVANIRNLYGTATLTQGVTPQAAVRSCRGSATRASVQCIIAAKSVEDLEACTGGGEFLEAFTGKGEGTPEGETEGAQGGDGETAPAQGEAQQPEGDGEPAAAPAQAGGQDQPEGDGEAEPAPPPAQADDQAGDE